VHDQNCALRKLEIEGTHWKAAKIVQMNQSEGLILDTISERKGGPCLSY